ncbi:MAG: deoxyribose-phosphate aldolase, partial [Sphingobacteriales bacterium]
YIDHTLLKPESTAEQIEKLCKEAIQYGFFAVCVPPYFVKQAKHFLEKAYMENNPSALRAPSLNQGRSGASEVKVATVAGFPLGYSTTEVKAAETEKALADGADEVDMVINIAAVKSGDWDYVRNDIETLFHICHRQKMLLKVIFETALLTDEEIVKLCRICAEIKVDFVKTSTGFSTAGATVHHVELMRKNLPDDVKIKAAGGIKNKAFAEELIAAGADRLGTSSSIQIIS